MGQTERLSESWTEEDAREASLWGWRLEDMAEDTAYVPRICVHEFVLSSDEEAENVVLQMAFQGCVFSANALRLMRRHNSEGFIKMIDRYLEAC